MSFLSVHDGIYTDFERSCCIVNTRLIGRYFGNLFFDAGLEDFIEISEQKYSMAVTAAKPSRPIVWLKQVAPNHVLRQWFRQSIDRWEAFGRWYRQQLAENITGWLPLVTLLKQSESLTLLYESKDTQRNQGEGLRDFLQEQAKC